MANGSSTINERRRGDFEVLPPGYAPVSRDVRVRCPGTQFALDAKGIVFRSQAIEYVEITVERYEIRTPGTSDLFDNRGGYAVGVNCPALLSGRRCGLYNPGDTASGVKVDAPRCFRFPDVAIVS